MLNIDDLILREQCEIAQHVSMAEFNRRSAQELDNKTDESRHELESLLGMKRQMTPVMAGENNEEKNR